MCSEELRKSNVQWGLEERGLKGYGFALEFGVCFIEVWSMPEL